MNTMSRVVAGVLAGVPMLVLVSCKPTTPPPQETGGKIEYAKEAVFPKYTGAEFAVYSTPEENRPTKGELQALLKRVAAEAGDRGTFVANPEMKSETELWLQNPRDPSAVMSCNLRTGDCTYSKGVAQYLGNRSTPGLLKPEQAVSRAKEYLRRLALPVNDAELVVEHVGGVSLGVHDSTLTTTYDKFTTVRFGRQLDSIPVVGHTRILVQMAEQGKLTKFVRQWTPLKRAPVKLEGVVAAGELKKGVEQAVLGENRDAQKVRIESVKLVYYDRGGGVIEPAVRVVGKSVQVWTDAAGKKQTDEFPYDTIVPLLKSPKQRYPFMHEGMVKVPSAPDSRDSLRQTGKSKDDLKQSGKE